MHLEQVRSVQSAARGLNAARGHIIIWPAASVLNCVINVPYLSLCLVPCCLDEFVFSSEYTSDKRPLMLNVDEDLN